MPDQTLEAQSPLGGYQENFGEVSLSEVLDLAIVSLAVPRNGEEALATALKNAFDISFPKTGEITTSKDGKTRLLGMSTDQAFVVFEHTKPDAAKIIDEALTGTAYCTLQSDNWVSLQISGPKCRQALERMCPIDLEPSVFPPNRVVRTVMEHMGTIVVPNGVDRFLLFSASSSARSFLHAVETSIRNTA